MGCASSKLEEQIIEGSHRRLDYKAYNHLVSLTSSTYGLLHSRRDLPGSACARATAGFAEREEEDDIEIINTWELMQGLEEEDDDEEAAADDHCYRSFRNGSTVQCVLGKENEIAKCEVVALTVRRHVVDQSTTTRSAAAAPLAERKIDQNSIDADCGPVFDPELLASLESALEEEELRERKCREFLERYPLRCPPRGGHDAVVLYTTTLRGIRTTFDDCNRARGALRSYGVPVIERDVSMHQAFRAELRRLLTGLPAQSAVPLPSVFIQGRYIGGAEEVVRLHEQGLLALLMPASASAPAERGPDPCQGCAGVAFVPCLQCSGSCKIVDEQGQFLRCPYCNENGLIFCPLCC